MAEPLVEGQPMGFVGWWRIMEMELWDADAVDLVSRPSSSSARI